MLWELWAELKKAKPLGFMAEFCPICRDVRAMRADRLGIASVSGLGILGEGRLVGHRGVCQTCESRRVIDPADYAGFLRRPGDIAELERKTYPDLRAVYAERLALEESLRKSVVHLSDSDRRGLIEESFTALAPLVQGRNRGAVHFDWIAGFAGVVTVLVPTGLLLLGTLNLDDFRRREALHGAAVQVAAIGALVTTVLLATEPRRFFSRHVEPRLARALEPLKPSRAELEECIAKLRVRGQRLAGMIRLDQLVLLLQNPLEIRRLGAIVSD